MILHLKNEEKQIEINLNFTSFFGKKHSLSSAYQERKQNQKLLIKYLIEYFAPNREKGVQMVNDWFKQALTEMEGEDTVDGSWSVLNESYDCFRKNYKLISIDTTPPIIKKINSYKANKKDVVSRILLSDCLSALVTTNFILYHYGDSRGLDIVISNNLIGGYEVIFKNIYFDIINNFRAQRDINLSELKIYDYLKANARCYDIKKYLKFFNSKEKIEISFIDSLNENIKSLIALKQGNIILMPYNFYYDITNEEDFTILEIPN